MRDVLEVGTSRAELWLAVDVGAACGSADREPVPQPPAVRPAPMKITSSHADRIAADSINRHCSLSVPKGVANRLRRMVSDSLRELLATGPLATVTTIDPDGTPHVTLAWTGFDGDELVMATFFFLEPRKLQHLRRDPRAVISVQAKEFS